MFEKTRKFIADHKKEITGGLVIATVIVSYGIIKKIIAERNKYSLHINVYDDNMIGIKITSDIFKHMHANTEIKWTFDDVREILTNVLETMDNNSHIC